jgi:hypothetical protein
MILLTLALLSPVSPSVRVADLLPSSPIVQPTSTRTYQAPLDVEVPHLELARDLGLQSPNRRVSYFFKARSSH